MPRLWEDSLVEHKQRLRQHVMAVAVDLVGTHGLGGVSMSQLAAAAGIGRATLYKYFPDVDSVITAWGAEQIGAYTKHVNAELAELTEPSARLHRFLELQVEHVAGHAHSFGVQALGSGNLSARAAEHVETHRAQLRSVVTAILRDGITAGEFRPDADPEVHAELILGLVAALRPAVVAGTLGTGDAVRALARLLADGLHR